MRICAVHIAYILQLNHEGAAGQSCSDNLQLGLDVPIVRWVHILRGGLALVFGCLDCNALRCEKQAHLY